MHRKARKIKLDITLLIWSRAVVHVRHWWPLVGPPAMSVHVG